MSQSMYSTRKWACGLQCFSLESTRAIRRGEPITSQPHLVEQAPEHEPLQGRRPQDVGDGVVEAPPEGEPPQPGGERHTVDGLVEAASEGQVFQPQRPRNQVDRLVERLSERDRLQGGG